MATRKASQVLQASIHVPVNCRQPLRPGSTNKCLREQQSTWGQNFVSKYTTNGPASFRRFSSTTEKKVKNRIYTPVRRPDELSTYILSSTSSRTPLITLWTASWCPSCRIVSPLINSLISSGIGEAEGGVGYCEVEFDSSEILDSDFGMQYMITSMPTLLTFDRGEVMEQSRTMDVSKMKDKEWLQAWIEREARRRGEGTGGGGGIGSGLFGGLFGDRR